MNAGELLDPNSRGGNQGWVLYDAPGSLRESEKRLGLVLQVLREA